jgi:hypothetical protein
MELLALFGLTAQCLPSSLRSEQRGLHPISILVDLMSSRLSFEQPPWFLSSTFTSKETSMRSNFQRLAVSVILPAGLAFLLCTQTANAQQRRGTLQRQNSGFGQSGRCGSGQSAASQPQLSTGLQPQLSLYYLQPPVSNFTPQLNTQAFGNGLQQQQQPALTPQQQRALNALQQYVYEAQLTGTDPTEALQSALLAMQINQRNAARRAAQQQNR